MKHFEFIIPEELNGTRLDQGLFHLMQAKMPLSKSVIRKLLVAGAVYLNKSRVRIASKTLRTGAKVELYYNEKKEKPISGLKAIQLSQTDILYEDENLIAVNKPSGLPMAPTLDEARYHLVKAVQDFLNKRSGQSGAYLGVHHRLDADTSGVVLFTKAEDANAGVAQLFQEHLAVKVYHALCHTKTADLPNEWAIRNQLLRIHPKKNKYRVGNDSEEGSFAYTECRLLARIGEVALLEARPITGRTHQIRVQLAAMGLPIVGDVIYGKKDNSRLMLHARRLSFPHPLKKQEITIEAPFDAGWIATLDRFGFR